MKRTKLLKDNEEKFAQLVANGMKQGDAFIEAFPERYARMKSEGSRHVQASRLADKCSLRIKEIQDIRGRALTKRFTADAHSWALQQCRIAFADPRQLFDPQTGKPLPPHKLGDDIAMALEGVETGKDGTKYRLARKNAALDAIARRLALYQEVPLPPAQTINPSEPVNTALLARRIAVMLMNAGKVNGVETVDVVPVEKTNGNND